MVAAASGSTSTRAKGTMTDRGEALARPGAMPVITAALGGFLILLDDPRAPDASGPRSGAEALGRGAAPRTILERRIIKTRIIITDAPTTSGRATAALQAPRARPLLRAGRCRAGGARPGRAGRSSACARAGACHEDVMTAAGTEYDTSFRCMGSDVRLLIGEPVGARPAEPRRRRRHRAHFPGVLRRPPVALQARQRAVAPEQRSPLRWFPPRIS